MCSFQAHQKTVYALVRFGGTVWSAASDGLVRVWPLEAGQSGPAQHLREFNIMPNHKSTLLALERHVISFDTSGAILIWNAEVRTHILVLYLVLMSVIGYWRRRIPNTTSFVILLTPVYRLARWSARFS